MANEYTYTYGDSFTDTDGVALTDHTPDSPTPFSWLKNAASSVADNILEIFSNGIFSDDVTSGHWLYYTLDGIVPVEVSAGLWAAEFDVDLLDLANGDGYVGITLGTGDGVAGYSLYMLNFGEDIELDVSRQDSGAVTQNFEFGDTFTPTLGVHTLRLEIDLNSEEVRAYYDGVLKTTMVESPMIFDDFTCVHIYTEPGTGDTQHAFQITSIGTPGDSPGTVGTMVLDRLITNQTGVYSGAS